MHKHARKHTHTQSHNIPLTHCSERDCSSLGLKDTLPHPTLFQMANTLSWLWCVRHSTFSLHVQVTCTVVKTTCSVFRARTQLGHWCSAPRPRGKTKVKNLHCQTALEWSAWCSVTDAPSPAQKTKQRRNGRLWGHPKKKRANHWRAAVSSWSCECLSGSFTIMLQGNLEPVFQSWFVNIESCQRQQRLGASHFCVLREHSGRGRCSVESGRSDRDSAEIQFKFRGSKDTRFGNA